MYKFRTGRRASLMIILFALLFVFFLTLHHDHGHLHMGNRYEDPASRPLSEDPAELLLTDDDVRQAASGAAQNATLGVSHQYRHFARSNLMISTTVWKDPGTFCKTIMAYPGTRPGCYVYGATDGGH